MKKIIIKVQPKSSVNKVEKASNLDHFDFLIKTSAPAEKGKANLAALKMLSDYLKIKISNLKIISGHKYKVKIIRIID